MLPDVRVWLEGRGQGRNKERRKSFGTDTNEGAKKWSPWPCGYKSTKSLAVDSCKSTGIKDTQEPGDWVISSSSEYRGVRIFEY